MRQFVVAALLSIALCQAREAAAQQSPQSVRSVRLTFQRVDQVALDFGVDTVALRRLAAQRLVAAGITVTQDPADPELTIGVRVPKSLAPVDPGILIVETALLEPTSSAARSTLWRGKNSTVQFTRYGSLRELVPDQLSRELDALLLAHRGA
jgi:hypothetical protein